MVIPLHDDNPARIRPFVTYALLALCVLAFLLQLFSGGNGERIVYALGVIPAVLLGHMQLPTELSWVAPQLTIVTSMFLHGSLLHLAGNMLYLWIFGNNVEDAMGHARFVFFYLICGCAAVFAQALPDPASRVPMIGASGAISGVLGAYMLLYPRARILLGLPLGFVIIRLGRAPALVVLAVWFMMQLAMQLMSGEAEGGVAFRAHIGGFIAGVLLVPVFKDRDVPLWRAH
ncbi:MAG: rhomboid family intramembrane serine protease [Steroidobacteraceae bacterium]